MGGCATKPRELKEETLPQPSVEDKAEVTAVEKATETEADDADDCRRKSLGQMFKESEERKVTSETEEVVVNQTITPPAPVEEQTITPPALAPVEEQTITPRAPVEEKEEQPKTLETPTPTVEKFVTPAAEETTASSETTVTTEEKQVDSSSNVEAKTGEVEAAETTKVEAVDTSVGQKEAASTEQANAELSAPLSTEKVVAESPKTE